MFTASNLNQEGFKPFSERLRTLKNSGRNPYVFGPALEANSPVFFGREAERDDLLGLLCRPDKPGSASLLGERRFGKSSLLNQVRKSLECEANLVTVHASAQSFGELSQSDFIRGLHEAICTALELQCENLEEFPALEEFLAAQAKNYRFVIFLDEFEAMVKNKAFDSAFFARLRVLGERPEYRTGYLVASRRPLKELLEDREDSSFWNIFENFTLGLLSEREARGLILHPLQLSLGRDDLNVETDRVMHLAGRHPAFIQKIMFRYWQAIKRGAKPGWKQWGRELKDFYHDLWLRRSPEERKILLEIAEGQQPSSADIVDELQRRGLVTEEKRLFSERFGELLLAWKPKRKKDLEKWLNEMNQGLKKSASAFDWILAKAEKIGQLMRAFSGKDKSEKEDKPEKEQE